MFTSVRLRKSARDIRANTGKTLMIVLATAVGLFAFGTLAQTRAILLRDTTAEYLARNPAQATLQADRFDDDAVRAASKVEGVTNAEGRRVARVRAWVPGAGWKTLVLIVLPAPSDAQINRLVATDRQWPPPQNTIALERASKDSLGANIGQPLVIEMPDGKQRSLPVSGIVYMALLLAVPSSMLAASFLSAQLAGLLNFDIRAFDMSPEVVWQQIAAGFVIPLAAAMLPILKSTGITVRQAISANNLDSFGTGRIDRVLSYLQRRAAAWRYALR